VSYGATVQYRVQGADKASACGAVAALVRSITPYSLYTPHTGVMWYSGQCKQSFFFVEKRYYVTFDFATIS
jgi:carboxypeptidase Q